jgi:hypothetical protein
MKRLLLALGLALTLSSSALSQPTIIGPAQTAICNQISSLAVGPTTITTAIAGKTGQSIFLCGWHITNTGATGTFTLTIGSGANCVTSPTVVVQAANVTSTAPSADHVEYATTQIPGGQSLCVTSSVATISYVFWFSQF